MNANSQFKTIEPNWKIENIRVFTTTNEGEISNGAYAGFNTAHHTGADLAEVNLARKILQEEIGRPINWLNQVHGTDSCECFALEADYDAAILHDKSYAIAIQTADCLPLVLADKGGEEVAILHCGWRGLAGGIIAKTFAKMRTESQNLAVWFGVCIDAQNYEVGFEVWEKLMALNPDFCKSLTPSPYKINHYMLDLIKLAKIQLLELGIDDFYYSNISSYDDPRFYSHRQNQKTGRNATIALLT